MFVKIDSSNYVTQTMKECLIKEQAYDEGFNDGVEETKSKIKEIVSTFTPTELESIASEAFDAGYDFAIVNAPNSERELQEEAWEQGFLAAVEEMTEDCLEEELSEYEFGAIDDVPSTQNSKGVFRSVEEFEDFIFSVDSHKKGNKEKQRKHSHYFKDTSKFDEIDTYLLARIWNIVDENGALLHALKKILDAGKRGAGKDKLKDIGEARDSLIRYLEIEELFQGD